MGFVEAVMRANDVDESTAEEMIDEQVEYIKENGMSYSDVEQACYDLGVEADYEMDLIGRLA